MKISFKYWIKKLFQHFFRKKYIGKDVRFFFKDSECKFGNSQFEVKRNDKKYHGEF